MKKIALIFAVAATFAACSNKSETTVQSKEEAFRQVRDSIQLDSFRRADAKEVFLSQEKEKIASRRNSSASSSERTYVKGVSETYTNTQPQKKGWSKAAKGAAIGAGAGAVTGIIVDKKDGRGAVVGGLVGAGAGYAIGRSQDKKDGRVQ
ncbi:MAG: hypothetical protein H7Y13_02795 [Sphingobacteriaceae bacterium]|nr:hypothetical protein [Sphingobacteriaceae bacterium]